MEKTAIKTFNHLCKSYFLDYLGKDLSPVTVNAKKIQLQGNVTPVIGKKWLEDISKNDAWDIVDTMRQRHLSESYIRATIKTTKHIFDYGILLGVITDNPFDIKLKSGDDEKFMPFNAEEMEKIRSAILGGRYGNFFGFILESGMMRQYALGLFWSDIDLENGKVTLYRRFISEQRNYVLRNIKHPGKTVFVSKDAVYYLKQEKMMQDFRKKRAGDRWNLLSDFVFTDDQGYPFPPETLTRELNRLAKLHDLPRLTLRNLRNQFLAENK